LCYDVACEYQYWSPLSTNEHTRSIRGRAEWQDKETNLRVAPDIHQFQIPIPNNPLGFLNAYLIQTPEGCLLIDTGWNAREAFDGLAEQLSRMGVGWKDLRYIVVTHTHPDHYGLVSRLVHHTRARLVIHEIEKSFLLPCYLESGKLADMEHWLRMNGVSDDLPHELSRASMEFLGLVEVAMPNMIVHGGEHIRLGDFDLGCVDISSATRSGSRQNVRNPDTAEPTCRSVKRYADTA
jgi:Metallo-beta-lactamase superfamily